MKVRKAKPQTVAKFPAKISFTVYGDSVPKARARVVGVRGNKKTKDGKDIKPHAFTPQKTIEWESSIFGQSLAKRPPKPWDGAIFLEVDFYLRMPKTKFKAQWKRELALEGKLRPVGKRDDLDNLLKSLKDALNGLYWLDDGQVVGGRQDKWYSDVPRVEVVVHFVPNEF